MREALLSFLQSKVNLLLQSVKLADEKFSVITQTNCWCVDRLISSCYKGPFYWIYGCKKQTIVFFELPFDLPILWQASRGGSKAAATSKMERFVIIVNGFQPLTIITKRSILDVAAALDPPLSLYVAVINFNINGFHDFNNRNSSSLSPIELGIPDASVLLRLPYCSKWLSLFSRTSTLLLVFKNLDSAP